MYINPFWCGVAATIFIEIGIIIIAGMFSGKNKEDK